MALYRDLRLRVVHTRGKNRIAIREQVRHLIMLAPTVTRVFVPTAAALSTRISWIRSAERLGRPHSRQHPNMPLAPYSQFPGTNAGAQDYLNILPPNDRARLQLNILGLLGAVHYTEIGHYADGYFGGDITSGPLKKFQQAIGQIGSTVQHRNINRRPYRTLMPQAIPQSINI